MHTKKHRHYVALPLLVFSVLLTSLAGVMQVSTARVTENQTADGLRMQQRAGVQTVEADATDLRLQEAGIVLVHGSALIQSDGLATLDMGAVNAQGISGAFHASRYSDGVSLAAITTPVLVHVDGEYLFIPIGKQWRSNGGRVASVTDGFSSWQQDRQTQPLPNKFLHEQLKQLAKLPPLRTNDMPEAKRELPVILSSAFPLLDGAQQKNAEREREGLLSALRYAVEHNDPATVEQIAGDTRFAELLRTDESREVIARLLARSPATARISLPLLSILISDPALWLLTTTHPAYASDAWTLPIPGHDGAVRMLGWFYREEHNLLPQAHHDLAVRGWQEGIAKELKLSRNPTALLEALLRKHRSSIAALEEAGFPERSRRLRDALLTVADPYRMQLSVRVLQILADIEAHGAVILDPVDLTAVSEQHEPEEEQVQRHTAPQAAEEAEQESLPPDQIEAMAEQLLSQAGALFTIETNIAATGPNTATVKDIVFSGPSRDRTFAFDLNVVTASVGNIQEDGNTFRYPMQIDKFAAWVTSDV